MTFLKAKWQNLILANYIVNPKHLEPYVPKGTQLDFYNENCYVSLVGFMFKDTKTLGLKFPFHTNFEEVNLRFYVKHNHKRGVVFIKEIVPKPLITFIANTLYKEHYQTCKMKHSWQDEEVSYSWKANTIWQHISVGIENKALEIKENSEEEFITEHYFGYTKYGNKTFQYEVKHPKWKINNVIDYNINVDFMINYGKNFEFLNTLTPSSVIHALGSDISVMNKTNML